MHSPELRYVSKVIFWGNLQMVVGSTAFMIVSDGVSFVPSNIASTVLDI